ncbi:branched-chain amino acid ABC transporter permease [Phreatobacter stygius]|nr:branched-chain amino acid ABC transporter permease [Phreatobacter stygius]
MALPGDGHPLTRQLTLPPSPSGRGSFSTRGAFNALRLAAALLFCLLLGACASIIEPDHLRVCRDVLPALHGEGSHIREIRYGPVTARKNTVRIDYLAREPGQPNLAHYATCGFAGGGTDAARFELIRLETERGPLSAVRLMILQRWWLGDARMTADAAARRRAQAAVPEIPMVFAYALQQGANGLAPAALYGLLASAYALVYGLIGRINLAFGEIAVAGAYAAVGIVAVAAAAFGLVPALILALCAGAVTAAATNLAIGRAVVAPIVGRRRSGQAVLVATVGLAVALSEALRLLHGSSARWSPPIASDPIALVRSGDFVTTVTFNQIGVVGFALIIALGLIWLLRRSAFGRSWRAFADDPGMAALFGVDPGRLVALTFALAGGVAGLAGFAHAVHFGSAHFALGTVFGLKALVAAILGGVGSVPGAFLGGLALGLAETAWSGYLPIEWRDPAVYIALVLLIVVRPNGLFDTNGRPA